MGTTSDHAGDDMEQHAEEHSGFDAFVTAHTDATIHQTTDQSDQPHNHSTPRPDVPSRINKQTTPKAIALLSTSSVNIPRLSQILLNHLLTSSPTLSLYDAQAKVFTALSHIHIYQPTSLPSLIATISSLPGYFLSPSNTSKERRLGGILISSPSAYFWEDKIAVAPTSASSTTGKFPALASTLRRVAVTLQAPVFYTTSHFSSPSASSASSTNTTPSTLPLSLSLPPALPPPFSSLPSLRLMISKLPVQGFTKDIDAETALRQKEARDAAVREGRFRVSVNQWGKEGSGNERDRNVGFELVIDGQGVRVV